MKIRIVTEYYDIQAFVDNELDPDDALRVRDYLETNPEAKRHYEELCRQKAKLKEWWGPKNEN